MKFRDLLFLEQEDPQDPFLNDDPENDANNPPLPDMGDDEDMGDQDEPQQPEQGQPREKKLTLTQQAKKRWLEENPGLSDFQLEDAAAFFRMRKDNLKEYHPYGYVDPQTQRHYINLPEVTALVLRFPQMEPILSQNDKMKDIRNYPWEVMDFYMDNVRAANAVIDEENLVPGTRLPLDEQLAQAKEKWNTPQNKIVDEAGVKVYKIESKNESIIYGSIQRILNLKRREGGNTQGDIYWCTTVPLNDKGRSNLWTTYRPSNAFYYIWDSNRDEADKNYCGSIQARSQGGYTFVDLYNKTIDGLNWGEIVNMYPVLQNKERLFPHFGTTPKEKEDLTIEKISMNEGHKYYFGTIPESYQNAYVDSGRHVNNLKAFLTMRPKTRKLYVDKTTLENNDVQTRFVCSDPNNEFGILELLRLQTKPEDLYKYLDVKILKTNLGVEEGIRAIKKLIIGTNWYRGLSDDEKNITLISKRTGIQRLGDKDKRYGLINTETGDLVETTDYVEMPGFLQSFVQPIVDENGKLRAGEKYMMRKYVHKFGDGNIDSTRGFYFFLNKNAFTKGADGSIPAGYLKGKYFTLEDGEALIQSKLGTGELRRM